MNPVDLAAFTSDIEVQEIIERGAGTVNITQGSDSGLIAGNKKITGLDPEKYYMVEEWDENGNIVSVQFVAANGERGEDLTDIGRVDGGELTGLTNRYNYRVRSAGPLNGNVSYTALLPPGSGTAASTSGAITLPVPNDGSSAVYTLTLPTPSIPSYSEYEIVKAPVSPAGSASPAERSGNDLLAIINKGMVIDYVFFAKIADNTFSFYVLRVTAVPGSPVDPGGDGNITITVTLSYTGDNSPVITPPPSLTYPQNDTGSIIITVSNANQYDNYSTNGIKWYIDGEEKGTGQTFSLNKELPEYKIVGKYIITVEASKQGIPYSATIEVTVTP